MRIVPLVLTLMLLLGVSQCSTTNAKNGAPVVGQAAPDFSLPGQDGTIWRLGDVVKRHRGVVIAFYPKDDTKL